MFIMATISLLSDVILNEIDIKRQELNSLVHSTAHYHSGDVLEKTGSLIN